MAASPRGLPDLSRYGVDSVVYHSFPINVHQPSILNRETSVHSTTDAPGLLNSPHGMNTEQNTQETHQPPIHPTNKSCSDNSTAREHNPLKRSFHVAMPKRGTAPSVADESAEEPAGQLERKKAAAQARRRLIFVHYKGRPGIPRSASKRSPMSPTTGTRSSNYLTGRKSPENTLDFELSGDDTNKQLPCKKQSQKASFLSVDETENRKVYKKQMSRSTSPILVQCSGEVVSDHCKQEPPPPPKTPESLPMPLSKTPVMPNAINERVNMSDEDSSSSTPAILVQCSGETVSNDCKQVKTNPCMVLTKGEDKSHTHGIKAGEGNITKCEVPSQTQVVKGEKGGIPQSQVMPDTRKSKVVKSGGNKPQIQSDAQRRADATKQRLLKFKTRDQKSGTSKPDIRKRSRSPRVQPTHKSMDNEFHELSDRKIPDSPSGVLIGTSTSSLAKVDQRQDQDNSQPKSQPTRVIVNTKVDRSVMTSPIKRKSSIVSGRSRPIRSKRGKRRVSSHKKVVKKDAATQHEELPPTKIVTSTYDGVSFISRQTRPKLETISDQNRRYVQLQKRSPFIVSTALTETNSPYKSSAEPWKSKISPLRGTRTSPQTGESKSPYPLNTKLPVAGQTVIDESNNLIKHSGTQLRNPEASRHLVSSNIPSNAPLWEEGNTALPRSRVCPPFLHQGRGKDTLHPTQKIQMSQSATNTGGVILPKIVTKWKSRDLSPLVAPPGHLKRRSEVVKMESLERISEDPESNVPSKGVVLVKKGYESMGTEESSSSPRITATSVTTLTAQLPSPARATASASVARDVAHRSSDTRARLGRHRDTDWRGEVKNRQDHLSNMNRTGNSANANVVADFKGTNESKTVKSVTQKGVCQVSGILKGSSTNNLGKAPNLLQINPISLSPFIEKQGLPLSSITGKTGSVPTTQTIRKEKRLVSSSKSSNPFITIHSRERTSSSRKLKRRPLSPHLIIKKARKQKKEEKVVTEKDYAAYKRRSDKAKINSTHTLSGRDPETIKPVASQGKSTASFLVDGASYIRRNDISKLKCLQPVKRSEPHEISTSDISREGFNASSSTMPCLTNVAAEYGMQNYRSPQAHSKIDQYVQFSKRGQPVQTVLHAQIPHPAQYNAHSLGVSQRPQFSNFSQNMQYAESPQRMQFTENPQYTTELNNSRQKPQYTQSSQPFQPTQPFQTPEHAQSSQFVQPSHASQPFQPPPSRHYIHLPQDIHCVRLSSYVQPGEYSQHAQYNVPGQAIPSAAQYPADTRETNSLRRTVSFGGRALHSNSVTSSSSRSKYVTEEPNREKVERARFIMSAEPSRRDMKHSTLGFSNLSQGGESRRSSEVHRANYPPLISSPVSSIATSVISSTRLAGAPGMKKKQVRKSSRGDDASRPIWSRGTRTRAPEQRGRLYTHQIRNKRSIVSPVKRRMIHYNGRIIGSRYSQLRGSHKSVTKGVTRPSSRLSVETEKSSADKSLLQYRSSGDSEMSVQGSSLAKNLQSPKLNPTGPEWKAGQTVGPFVRSTKFIQPGRIVPVPHQVQIVGTPPPDLASFVDDAYGQSSTKMETGTNASHEGTLSSSKYKENSARRHLLQTHGIKSSNIEISTAECTQPYPEIQMMPPNEHVNQSVRYNISPNFIPTPRQPSAVATNSLYEASRRYTENMPVTPPPLLPHIHVQYTAGTSISAAGPNSASATVGGEQRTDEKASPKHPADMYLQISWNDAQCGPGSQEQKRPPPVESSDSTRASALVPASPQSPKKESPVTTQLTPRNPTTLTTNRAFPSAAPWHLAKRRLATQSAGPTTINSPVTTKRSTPSIGTTGPISPKEGPPLVVMPTQIHRRGPASPAAVPCMARQQTQQIRKGTTDVPEKIVKDPVNPAPRTSAIDKAHRLMTILTPKNSKLTPGPSRKGRPPMKSFISGQQVPGQNRRKVQPSMLAKNLLPQMVEASVQTPHIVTPIEVITQGQKVAVGKTEACVQTPLLMQWGRCITSPFIQKQIEHVDETTESRKSSPKQSVTKQGYKWSLLAPKLAESHSLKAAPVWLPNLVQQIRGYASTYMEKQKNEPPPTSQIPRSTNSPKAPKQQTVGANSSVMSMLDDSSTTQPLNHKVESSLGPDKSTTGEEKKSVQISREVENQKEAQSDEPVLESKTTILPKFNKLGAPTSDGNKIRPSVQSGQAHAEIRKIYQSPYKAKPFIPANKKMKHNIVKTSLAPSGTPSKKCVRIPMKPSSKRKKTLSSIAIRGPDHPFNEKPGGTNTIKKQLKTNPTGLRKVYSKNWQKNSGRSRQLEKPKRAPESRGQSSGAARTAGTKQPVSQHRHNDGHGTKPSPSFKPAMSSIVPVGQPDFSPKVTMKEDVSREWKVATGLNMRVERMPRSHSTGPFHSKLNPDANKYSPFMSQPDLNKPSPSSVPTK